MNLIISVFRKPFSIGAILFFWPPVTMIVVTLVWFGLKYWYFTAGMILFLMVIMGIVADRESTRNESEDEAITNRLISINSRAIRELDFVRMSVQGSEQYYKHWEKYRELCEAEEKLLAQTKVVNLTPLGHKIGRVYKR